MSFNEFRLKLMQVKLGNNKQFFEPVYKDNENQFLNEIATTFITWIDIIVFNTYDLTPKLAKELGIKIKQLCAEFETMFILKGKVDIAYIIKPEAILLDKDNINAHDAREILGEDILVGHIGNLDSTTLEGLDFIINEHAIFKEKPCYQIYEGFDKTQPLILQYT